MSRAGRRLLGALLLGVVLYGVAIAVTGYHEMEESLSRFHWAAFAAAIALSSANYLFRFFRWEYYLRRLGVTGVSRGDSGLVFLSGFVLTVTPGKVGEVFKSAVLSETHGVPIERTAPIVVTERLTDVMGVVLLILCGSTGFSSGLPWAVAGAVAVAVLLALILSERPARALLDAMAERPRLAALVPRLRAALESLRLLSTPRALVWPVVLSTIAWGLEGIGLWVLVRGFGASPPLALTVFFYETASLAGALVPVPGGLGVVEALLREQLVLLGGVPVNVSTASMILIRLATLWWAVVVGFVALGILRARYPRLKGAAA